MRVNREFNLVIMMSTGGISLAENCLKFRQILSCEILETIAPLETRSHFLMLHEILMHH